MMSKVNFMMLILRNYSFILPLVEFEFDDDLSDIDVGETTITTSNPAVVVTRVSGSDRLVRARRAVTKSTLTVPIQSIVNPASTGGSATVTINVSPK